jgi:hypothetical protein
MLAGLKQNADRMAKRGLDATFVANYEAVHDNVRTLDNEQEKLKADEKAKTEQLKKECQQMETFYAEAKKTVKLEIEPSRWKEFGIQDKH